MIIFTFIAWALIGLTYWTVQTRYFVIDKENGGEKRIRFPMTTWMIIFFLSVIPFFNCVVFFIFFIISICDTITFGNMLESIAWEEDIQKRSPENRTRDIGDWIKNHKF